MIILGIDPGTARIGYGLIEKDGGKLKHIESGLIDLPVEKSVEGLLKRARPDKAGLEKLFFTKNRKTALRVAETRGVILNTLNKGGIPVFEIGPNEVKLAVTGDGRASKGSVARMVGLFLSIEGKMVDDASDALAIAIAVSNLRGD